MKYRADIDGLRAVSVLGVLAAHTGIHAMPGGFLGVDVFFVISGYLISGLVFGEITRNQFSLRSFYERRIRRIVPAVAGMLVIVSIGAYRYLLPAEMNDFGKSLLAAIAGASNFYFWSKAGYFAPPSAAQPLLHTWSLAAEEQFYIVWPLLLYFVYRYRRPWLKPVAMGLFVVSLAVSAAQDVYAESARFYLLPARAWELLAGALLSLDILPRINGSVLRQSAGAAGLALIGASFVIVQPNEAYLGLLSSLPCLGALLVIAAGETGPSWTGRLLAAKPLVFIGLISYSLYLWHWPVIVFHRMGLAEGVIASPHLDKLVVIVVSIALAIASWWFIERPFRRTRARPAVLFGSAGAVFGAFAAWAAIIIVSSGLGSRYAPDTLRLSAYLDYDQASVSREGTCFITDKYSFADFDATACLHGTPDRRDYLLVGDSHAAHLWYGLSHAFADKNILEATAGGCAPSPEPRLESDRTCRQLTEFLAGYLPTHRVDTLLLEAAWGAWDLPSLPPLLEQAKHWANHVVLFGPMVRYDSPLPRILAVSAMEQNAGYPRRHRLDELYALDKAMAQIASDHGITYISFFALLCKDDACETMTPDGVPMLYDYGHLTREGSLHVAEYIRDKNELP